METKNELPEGFTCAECGRYAKFSAWVAAHWREVLVHTCECGTRAELHRGRPIALIPAPAFHLAAGEELDTYGGRYGVERNNVEPDADYRARILSLVSLTYPTKGSKS